MYIQGKNVILRSKKMEDVNNDFSWRTNEELSRLDATTPINLSIEPNIALCNITGCFFSPFISI